VLPSTRRAQATTQLDRSFMATFSLRPSASGITSVTPRFRSFLILALVLMFLHSATRVGLLVFNGDTSILEPIKLASVFFLGIVYDFSVVLWFLVPLALVHWLTPDSHRGNRVLLLLSSVIALATLLTQVFVSVSEYVFWNEFSSRFNFIAVDYLIYSREVLGNIRESYNLPLMLTGVVIAAIVLGYPALRAQFGLLKVAGTKFTKRGLAFLGLLVTASAATYFIDTDWKQSLVQPQLVQLAGNGPWEFFHAFRYNQINYAANYKTMPDDKAAAVLKKQWETRPGYRLTNSKEMPIEREVTPTGAQKPLHLVMVSIESFGAEFIESLGGTKGVAPNYEKLAKEGLAFTQLYATGTRTVRGLEALTLSVPPTPGHAIPMRPNNTNLFSLGSVFRSKGYESIYIYGGYSYFDNMKSFFGGNGYTVIDRTAIDKNDIHHENIWGVSDEDLFALSLREIDTKVAQNKKVFAHVMTTSNHRPYTYPNGRIDIPSGTGRLGAVKYTDFAIGKFVDEAKKKPWFKDTIFVFVADHTSIARGKTDLPLDKYHIPMAIYSPGNIKPAQIDQFASQIDVAPTLLGLLNISYTSQFFGKDVLKDGLANSHAHLGNYQTVGIVEAGRVVELKPKQFGKVYDTQTRAELDTPEAQDLLEKAVALYQIASARFASKR
jgi:phosphoglycerol transferase MdoB-like AlkP superfamily enzyme